MGRTDCEDDLTRAPAVLKGIVLPTIDTIRAFKAELSGHWAIMLAHELPPQPPH